eukprot:XP_017454490.1 PREDICTED: uncharacterized protein LOC102548111 isoform X5 [Rattus norvegicus]
MTRAAPPLAACANRRTLPARDRARSAPRRRRWSLLRSRLGRPRLEPGHGGGRGGFPGGAESSPVPVAARGVYIPGRGQRDEAAPIRAGCALLFARSLAPASAPPGPRRRPRSLGKRPISRDQKREEAAKQFREWRKCPRVSLLKPWPEEGLGMKSA